MLTCLATHCLNQLRPILFTENRCTSHFLISTILICNWHHLILVDLSIIIIDFTASSLGHEHPSERGLFELLWLEHFREASVLKAVLADQITGCQLLERLVKRQGLLGCLVRIFEALSCQFFA